MQGTNDVRRDPLNAVTTSDLSRSPGKVLDRVARGERLLVFRRKRAIATLQPLDGGVFQPFTGAAQDIFGWPIGSAAEEAAKLSAAQRALLRDCVWNARVGVSEARASFPSVNLLGELET